MLKSERINEITKLLMKNNRVTVNSLSSMLGVSEVTIRTDLHKLETEGIAARVHGGAVLNENRKNQKVIDDIVAAINVPYDKEQEHIGNIAAGLVNEGEWVYIGSGTTCYYIAKALLKKRNLNILTNNMYVVNILIANPYINVIVCGGTLAHGYNCTYGDLFDKSIRNMNFSKSFFTVGGAGIQSGYTVASEIEVEILRTVRGQTKELILVIDSSKFNKTSFMRVGDMDISNVIITDGDIPPEYLKYYSQKGINVYGS